MDKVKVHSIFNSINGEVCQPHQGSLTTFVRLFSCNCRCNYCDSKFSYEGSFVEMRVRDIVKEVQKLNCKNVTITGGEPLLQKGTISLLGDLLFADFNVSVETNGTIFIPSQPYDIHWIADYKLPSSGCEAQMKFKNYYNLYNKDFVKFVISDRKDFDRALEVIPKILEANNEMEKPKFAFSPAFGKSPQTTLVEWMLADKYLCKIGAIFSLQIHKVLNVA